MPTAIYDPDTGALLGLKRLLFAIYQDVGALTGPQKNAIWNDLNSGTPPLMSLSEGPNAAAIFALQWSAVIPASISDAEKAEAKQRIIAMWISDNPLYAVHPPYDPSIDIPGFDPIPPGS